MFGCNPNDNNEDINTIDCHVNCGLNFEYSINDKKKIIKLGYDSIIDKLN